jgi:L-ascorbate metabolism protein UlaG (beta-lactamase superfamily)
VRITLIAHSTVLIESGSTRILTDPYFGRRGNLAYARMVAPARQPDELRNVAAVLVSHAHFDHIDRRYLKSLDPRTPVYAPRLSARWIAVKTGHATKGLRPWAEVDVADARVTAVPAMHTAPALGYVVADEGKVAYFAGDTFRGAFMKEIRERCRPDVCLMPVTTFRIPMTMGNRSACEATKMLGARVVIPIHLGIQPRSPLLRRTESVESFRNALGTAGVEASVVSLAPGDFYEW